MDMLLSTGEQISVALCAMALEAMGLPCVSLTAWQVGNPVHCCPLRCPDQEDRFRAYPVRAGPAPHRHRHRLSGRGPQRRCDHSGPGRLRHQRRGPGGGLSGPTSARSTRMWTASTPRTPASCRAPEAGGDHLRRDAGAGQPGRPGPPQPQRGAGQEVQSEFGSRVQLGAQARHESEGGHKSGDKQYRRCRQGHQHCPRRPDRPAAQSRRRFPGL